jgi:ABC-type multidrug transport system fused ATPase/permease subunit
MNIWRLTLHNKTDIEKYVELKKQFGNFWGLYCNGVEIKHIKWTITNNIILTILTFCTTYYVNQIIVNKDTIDLHKVIFIFGIIEIIKKYIPTIFYIYVNEENICVSSKIANFVKTIYDKSSYTWKQKNTDTAQNDSLREVFYSYNGITHTIIRTVRNSIDAVTILTIGFMNDITIGLFIIIGTTLLYRYKKYFDKELVKIDESMHEKVIKTQIKISNRITNSNDVNYNPSFRQLVKPQEYDIIGGYKMSNEIWTERDKLSTESTSKIASCECILIVFAIIYLYLIDNTSMVLFVIIYRDTLFSFLHVLNELDETKNIYNGRLTSSYEMINTAIENNSKIQIIIDTGVKDEIDSEDKSLLAPDTHEMPITDIQSIVINKLNIKVSDILRLIYDGIITMIFIQEFQIILLNGKKGCGKSVTMATLGGFYDNQVSNGILVNGILMKDEFRDLNELRVWIRQLVVDDYKANKNKTVTMTLNQLFPNGTYDEIKKFLENFDMAHKLPEDLDTPVSKDQNGLSPGETQCIVVASQIWKAFKVNASFLLLDEIERNIDFETVRKIFTFLKETYKGTIFLITHLPELKRFIAPSIVQSWNYKENTGDGILTFEIVKNEGDKILTFEDEP